MAPIGLSGGHQRRAVRHSRPPNNFANYALFYAAANTWKEEIGYHVRSLVENTNFRIKTLFGERLASRRKQGDTQDVEIALRVHALNVFSELGMPESYVLPEARAA